MSTKIHNGYTTNLNLYKLLDKLSSLIQLFEQEKIKIFSELLISKTVFTYDKNVYNKVLDNDLNYICRTIYDKYDDIVQKKVKLGMREPDVDLEAYCSVYPIKSNKTLILFYAENSEMNKVWEQLDFVKDYHYQNSTDKPEHISNYNWNKRKENWNKVLDHSKPYTFKFTHVNLPNYYSIKPENFIPSNEVRAIKLLKDNYIDDHIKLLMNEASTTKFSGAYYSEAIDNWIMFIETEQYKIKLDETINSLTDIKF
jgi:hypothetical protein